MRQFDILPNPSRETAARVPYLVVLQNDLLRELSTTVVAPLIQKAEFGRPASVLNPVFEVQGEQVVLSVAELAGISRHQLGEPVGSVAGRRDEILAAIDLLFTGI